MDAGKNKERACLSAGAAAVEKDLSEIVGICWISLWLLKVTWNNLSHHGKLEVKTFLAPNLS